MTDRTSLALSSPRCHDQVGVPTSRAQFIVYSPSSRGSPPTALRPLPPRPSGRGRIARRSILKYCARFLGFQFRADGRPGVRRNGRSRRSDRKMGTWRVTPQRGGSAALEGGLQGWLRARRRRRALDAIAAGPMRVYPAPLFIHRLRARRGGRGPSEIPYIAVKNVPQYMLESSTPNIPLRSRCWESASSQPSDRLEYIARVAPLETLTPCERACREIREITSTIPRTCSICRPDSGTASSARCGGRSARVRGNGTLTYTDVARALKTAPRRRRRVRANRIRS